MSDWHYTDDACPHCGEEAVRWRNCDNILCDDGSVDNALDNEEDFLLEGVSFSTCPECKGKGIIHWCASCGREIDYPDAEDLDDEFLETNNY
ncbi:hypothetical protein QNI19_14660 [Cytophagaceae bacterium DM2B3-1]|uniref:Uncharacterized protein n=1 Tax=Xanthocytophaga flava TaxID=3048013 RepID=A0ABT7CMH1_9BACT|nr:hypothetical protein [Xanthocytophaga flavus]MDJ1494182.1 hypothetical protein [Xanthocytophaga flavus]